VLYERDYSQLFFNYLFRYLLLTSKMEEESQEQLQKIFTEMQVGRMKYCITQTFCGCWKGWGRQLVNPREQQDAGELNG
jgi:hypothetical protein